MGAGAFSAQAQTEQAAGSERTKVEMKTATFDLQAQLETANVNVQYDDFGATVTGALKNTGSSACARPSVQIVSYRGESLLGTEDLPLDATQELTARQSVEFSVQAMPPAAQESFI